MSDVLAARHERMFDLERNASTQPFDWAGSWLRRPGGRVITYPSEGAF
jgi:hypothetical protein